MENNLGLSKWKLPLYKIYTDNEDVDLITKIIKRGTEWAIGPEIEEFENNVKNYIGCDYCLTLNSGTSALHAAFLAYGLSNNNEIIVPSFSFIATANATLFVGAKPVFADIEMTTYGLDPEHLKRKITSKTKAIVPVDYAGLSCKIFDIQRIAEEKGLYLIEDAAESLGASINERKVGSISETSIFSFCGNKVLTTGEGGALVTNSKEIYDKVKLIRSHGRIDSKRYFDNPNNSNFVNIGYNWRMSSLTAGLGITQLNKLDKIIDLRRRNAKYITQRLSKHPQITTPSEPIGLKHIFQMYSIRLSERKIRDELHSFLIKKQIFSKIYFEPIHLTEFYKKSFNTKSEILPNTEKVSNSILTIPLYPNMTSEEMSYLIDSINEFFENSL
jgi:perosamine synthetase